jgi:membrane-associated protein
VGKNIDLIFVVIVLVSVLPIAIEFLRGRSARRQAEAFGTDPVDEFIEEHEPVEERKTNPDWK